LVNEIIICERYCFRCGIRILYSTTSGFVNQKTLKSQIDASHDHVIPRQGNFEEIWGMKKTSSILHLFFVFLSYSASAQETAVLEWAKRMGGTGSDTGQDMTIDAAGNIYTTGSFSGTVDFDPGAGVFNLTSAGSNDIFISKLDANGNFVWARAMGGVGSDGGWGIAVDIARNVYITGGFQGTADFDPGAGTFTMTAATTGQHDIFIAKVDANGNFVWAKGIIGGTWWDNGLKIVLDGAANVHVVGRFYFQGGARDFDPGPGTFFLTAGHEDAFILKLDTNGNFIWARNFGGGFLENRGYSIVLDAAGNVYTTGYFEGTIDFDPGVGTSNLTASGDWDVFISKLTKDGNFVWAKSMVNSNPTYYTDGIYGSKIALDATGNVYTTSRFNGTVDFDPGAGISNLTSLGGFDIYVSKLTTNGDFVWAKSMGSTGYDEGINISLDGSGDVYVSGLFTQTVDFNPGAGINNLTSAGNNDIFITKLDTNGTFKWARSMGGTGDDRSLGLVLDATGNPYLMGWFQGTADFDPGACTFNLTSAGSYDIFVQKLNQTTLTPLSISSITPSGTVGSSVTITGTGFSTIPGNNVVKFFNNVAATVTASTATSITTTVPSGATTGTVAVTVDCNTATTTNLFCVPGSPLSSIGLMASYPFTGNANDASGNNNNGTINGATLTTDRFGNANSAFLFNGSSSYISIPNSTSLQSATTRLSLNAWVNLAGYSLVGSPGFGPILAKSNSASSNFMYSFIIGSSPAKIYADINNFSNFTSGDYTFCLNQWYMVTVVLDVNTAYFYVNGILVGTQIFATNITPDALPLEIGRDVPGLTEIFNGKLDDIRLYNRALSECEIASLYTPAATVPTITGLAPASGAVGTSITINGTNFDTTPANNIIRFFNNVTATATSATATSITTTVPTSATTGKISVTVGCYTAISASDFTVTLPPSIIGFTPPSGTIGATVTITGTNFSTTPPNNIVAFNGAAAIVTASTATSITTTVPTGATTGKITVTVAGNSATSANDFTVNTNPTNQPPLIASSSSAVPINGIVTIDLLPLLSDPDDNLDLSTLSLNDNVSEQGAAASITQSFQLVLDYGSVAFAGTDRISLSVCDLVGECDQQNLSIEVQGDVTIYNAISPNGDDLNKIFYIKYIDLLPETQKNKVTIYNRWGSQVFEVTDYNNTTKVFSGFNNNGGELPSGTYYYKIEFAAGKPNKTGYLALKR